MRKVLIVTVLLGLTACATPSTVEPTTSAAAPTSAFDGSWNGVFATSGGFALDGGPCVNATGEGQIVGGEMIGSADTRYGVIDATAQISADGDLTGMFSSDSGGSAGTFNGKATGPNSFSGTYADELGCSGTFTLTKL